MSDEQQPAPLYAEQSVVKVSARTAGILLLFTLAFTALMAGMHTATEPRLRASAQAEKHRLISDVLPSSSYNNDLLQDRVTLPANAARSTGLPLDNCRAVPTAADSASSPVSMPKRNARPRREVGTAPLLRWVSAGMITARPGAR